MTGLDLIVDTLLPGDESRSLPPASRTDFDRYLTRLSLGYISTDFIAMLDKLCSEKFKSSFTDMNSDERIKAVDACKLVNVRLFSDFVTHLLKCYYTSPTVIVKIGAGSVPPFPAGNLMAKDDWTLLESVYERGKCYRDVKE
jgi:hypothetical protein